MAKYPTDDEIDAADLEPAAKELVKALRHLGRAGAKDRLKYMRAQVEQDIARERRAKLKTVHDGTNKNAADPKAGGEVDAPRASG